MYVCVALNFASEFIPNKNLNNDSFLGIYEGFGGGMQSYSM